MEAMSVTGSNIKRMDQEKVLPVTVLNLDQIAARDAATPVDMLLAVPQITNVPTNETASTAAASRGDNANVALRGIGASDTLVLLNGRRMPVHPLNASSVNVNTLPSFGLQQIEVLRDGASAIYGSDAVAGVVNYVTKTQPSGAEISARFGVTEHGGGMDGTLNIAYGKSFANGKGSWLSTITGYNRDAIYFRQRAYSSLADKTSVARPPFNVAGSAYDARSATATQYPSFTIGSSATITRLYPINGVYTFTTAALPLALYADFNQYDFAQPMSRRLTMFNRAEYDVTPSIRAFGELSFYASHTQAGRRPISLSAGGHEPFIQLPVDNPYNPYGSRFYSVDGSPNADGTARITGTPQTVTVQSILNVDNGPEHLVFTDSMYRILAGLKGRFGTSSWTWEAAFNIGEVGATDATSNHIRASLLQQAASRTDAQAWNPFLATFKVVNNQVVYDKAYANPYNVRAQYVRPLNRWGNSQLISGDARFGGNVVDLWAGPIAAATGVEWRSEYVEDTKDPYAGTNPVGSGLDPNNNDFLLISPKFNYHASRKIYSGYAETVVPLTAPKQQIPGLYSLELNASGRYERYSDFGSTTKPKFGANWKPVSWVMVRASLNQGFSAPDLRTLYQPSSYTLAAAPGTLDTVRNNFFLGAGLAADARTLTRSYTVGSATLKPETSKGRTIGVVVDVPKWIKGLSFSVDYWQLDRTSLITSIGRDVAVDEALIRAYTQAQLAKGVPIDSIDTGYNITPGNPASTYVGDVNTLRNPITAADRATFSAANAKLAPSAQMAAVGTLFGTVSQSINSKGKNFVNGLDYGLSYTTPRFAFGQVRFSTDWSEFMDFYSQTTTTSPKDDQIVSLTTSKWKGSTTVRWSLGRWMASVSHVYSSPVRTGATTTAAVYQSLGAPSYIKVINNNGAISYVEKGDSQEQYNVAFGYGWGKQASKYLRNTSVRLGCNNLLDGEPTRTASASGYSGSTGTSLFVGRAYTLQVSRTF
jgi:outer membrane receptor protein involved in Fe transport